MKKYLIISLSIFFLAIALVYLMFKVEYKSQQEVSAEKSLLLLNEASVLISENLANIASDVLFLSHTNNINNPFSNSQKPIDASELIDFMEHHKVYDQLRTINMQGEEVFRINRVHNTIQVVPKSKLQSKKSRYYLKEALKLDAEEFYISPLDLNMENNKVEVPYKPTIRVATPLFNNLGEKQGILVLNILYEEFLTNLKNSLKKDNAELYIANNEGYWLIAPKDKDSWIFMFGKHENQLKKLSPELWEKTLKELDSSHITDQYIYSYKNINPLKILQDKDISAHGFSKALKEGFIDKRLQWSFIIAIPNQFILQKAFKSIQKGIPYLSLAVLIILILSIYLMRLINKILLQSEELKLAASCFLHADDGMVITDNQTQILQVNPRFQNLTGYAEHELIGVKTNKLASGFTDTKTYKKMWHDILNKGKWEGEIKDRKKDGTLYVQWLRIIAIKNQSGDIKNYLGVTTDITDKKLNDEIIHKLAFEDIVTSLPNKKYFQDKLLETISSLERTKRSLAILFIDLDNFKLVNDTAGHIAGDKLLLQVANRLKACLRENDILARFGGDEFFILIDFADEFFISVMAQRLLQSLQEPISINGHKYYTSASMGIAFYPENASSSEELIQHADTAMYQAKEAGKNRYRFFDTKMNTQVHKLLNLEKNLQTAIENNEFELYYQPQVSVKTKTIIGAEALIRWKNPELGNVSPVEFIPVAEKSEIIIPITMWVIKEACKMVKILEKIDKNFTIAVNISSVHIKKKNFDEEIYNFIISQNVTPKQIQLEITEGSLIDNVDTTVEKLDKLKSYGFRIAIDDFGTGYSSLSYLKKFGFHKLKIDQAFIRDTPHNEEDVGITKLIIAMSKVLNMKVIAEGVETLESLEFLAQNDCDIIQGYYYSKPLPAKEFLEYYENFS
jgi:diguanylate cyclase (GGDEF)-like protein/PAS domain S-box-containing protein